MVIWSNLKETCNSPKIRTWEFYCRISEVFKKNKVNVFSKLYISRRYRITVTSSSQWKSVLNIVEAREASNFLESGKKRRVFFKHL